MKNRDLLAVLCRPVFYLFLLLHIVLRVRGRRVSSLRLLLLYHFHDPAEAGRPQGRAPAALRTSTALVLSVGALLGAACSSRSVLLWQLGQDHLAVFGSLHNHIGDDRLDALVVAEGAPDALDQVLSLVWCLNRNVILRRGCPELVRVRHDSGLGLAHVVYLVALARLFSGADAGATRASPAATPGHLPAGDAVSYNRLLRGRHLLRAGCPLEPIVIKVIKQKRGLVRLHFLGQELFNVLLFGYLYLKSRCRWVLLLSH